jgi:hypothetical protein
MLSVFYETISFLIFSSRSDVNVLLSFQQRVVFQPQFVWNKTACSVGRSVTHYMFSCLLVFWWLSFCVKGYFFRVGNRTWLLTCSSVLTCQFHRHFVSDKSAILNVAYNKISTVICRGTLPHTFTLYTCLHFGSLFYSKSFLCLSPHVGTAFYIHKCYFFIGS